MREREHGADVDAVLRVAPLDKGGVTGHSQGTSSVCGNNYAYVQYLQLHMIGCGASERDFVSPSRHRLLPDTRVISARQTISSHEYTNRIVKHIGSTY